MMLPITHSSDAVAPLLITRRNTRELVGLDWQWVLRFARKANLPMLQVGRKIMFEAGPLLEALRRQSASEQAPRELTDAEERDAMRRRVGLQIVGGAR